MELQKIAVNQLLLVICYLLCGIDASVMYKKSETQVNEVSKEKVGY